MKMKFMNTLSTQRSNLRACAWLSLLLMAAPGQLARAADGNPPERLTYQSFLVDGNGNALGASAPKNYDVIFRVYDASSGGNLKWSEQQTVTVDKGYFSVLLGEGSQVGSEAHPTLSAVFYGSDASDRFVGITVKGIGPSNSDVDILPRLQMLTSPYSYLARNAVNAANLANSANSQIVTVSGNNVGINKALPTSALDVTGSGVLSGNLTAGPAFMGDVGYAGWAGFANKNSANTLGYALLQNNAGINTILNAKNGAGSTIEFRFDNNTKMTLDPNGYLSVNGSLGVGVPAPVGQGFVYASGPSACYQFADRTAAGQNWTWYANGGTARLWNSANGDRFAFDYATGKMGVYGNSVIELGYGLGKEVNNGKIGYQTFTDGLDIVGAGTTSDRKISLHTQGGLNVYGSYNTTYPIYSQNFIDINGANGGGLYWGERNNFNSRYCLYGHDGMATIWSSVAGRDVVAIQNNGWVGINKGYARCPLDIAGYQIFGTGGYGYLNYNGASHADGPYSNIPYSVLADQRIGAIEFNAFSDRRIKSVVGVSNSKQDLELIRKLSVTDYRMKDVVTEGEGIKKGFIAQEVEKLIPEAVTMRTNFIPNIYTLAAKVSYEESTKTLTLTMTNAHGLKKGTRVRVMAEDGPLEGPVDEVVNDKKFRMTVDAKEAPRKVFVFGTEVDDFRSLNYDRIFTTGISAIQELARKAAADETRIAELETKAARVDKVEKELSELKQLVAKIVAQQEKRAAAVPAENLGNH